MPLIFKGWAHKKYFPSLTFSKQIPSNNTMLFFNNIRWTSIGESIGPTDWLSFPNNLILKFAKTSAASFVTTQFPLINILSYTSFYFETFNILKASSLVTNPSWEYT